MALCQDRNHNCIATYKQNCSFVFEILIGQRLTTVSSRVWSLRYTTVISIYVTWWNAYQHFDKSPRFLIIGYIHYRPRSIPTKSAILSHFHLDISVRIITVSHLYIFGGIPHMCLGLKVWNLILTLVGQIPMLEWQMTEEASWTLEELTQTLGWLDCLERQPGLDWGTRQLTHCPYSGAEKDQMNVI